MLYLLQISAYTGIMYLAYLLMLRNRAAHVWNRFYLLVCATLPLVLPFVFIPGLPQNPELTSGLRQVLLPEVNAIGGRALAGNIGQYSAGAVLTLAYIIIAACLLTRIVVQYIAFRRFVNRSHCELLPGDIRLITGSGVGPGSFGRYIFFPETKTDTHILEHEMAHVVRRHSIDIMYMRLLESLFWPNLMLYLIKKELRAVHEFDADSKAAAGRDTDTYLPTLLNSVFGTNVFSLSHTFFHHPIKRRIVMLQKTPQSRTTVRTLAIRSGIATAILIAGVVYLQSCNRQPVATQPGTTAQAEDSMALRPGQVVYDQVDQMPEPVEDLAAFISSNVKYPEKAKAGKIEGRVVVKFVVDEDGNVKAPAIARSPDTLLSVEALRVVKLMPGWKPGLHKGKKVAVNFTLPISFRLQ